MLRLCRIFLVILLSVISFALYASEPIYKPTHDSVSQHPLPTWYQEAKFGVLIHYGIYTVPGWAPLFNPVGKLFSHEFFVNNPYPEWYLNSMQINESPTAKYHLKMYGPLFKYESFAPQFNQALAQWNPDHWSELLAAAGVKYVVFVTKHHDGFLLWPSQFQHKQNWVANRDVVGELTDSVRKHGMRMGLYYSGGYDWSWQDAVGPIVDVNSAIKKVPQSPEYAEYVDQQWHELIEKYHPDLLWNDIALPQKVNKWKLFADYYNKVPEGVVNNRWEQGALDFAVFGQPDDRLLDFQMTYDWFDYYSPEYLTSYRMTRHTWEADHGPGYGFGYNRNEYEHPEHFKSLDDLIIDLADLVSKNGNLLLGIGPMPDGTIPEYERTLLLGIGEWLHNNGEAIYATRPWDHAEGSANLGAISVRFTQDKNNQHLYAILLKNPKSNDVIINNLPIIEKNTKVEVLNGDQPISVKWIAMENDLKVVLSGDSRIPKVHPLVLRISPVPFTR